MLVKPMLSDGREMRALSDGKKNTFTQSDMFRLGRLLLPPESVMSVREQDQSLQSGAYQKVNPNHWWRCRQFGFYQKDHDAPLGKEIVWIENGITYNKLIPDIPVKVKGKVISLRNAVGMGVYDSIDLLKIEQKDSGLFEVSVVDPGAVKGRIMVVDFVGDGWAIPDKTGLPIASKRSTRHDRDARYGNVKTNFCDGATGWHGSLTRYDLGCWRRVIGAFEDWSKDSGVAVVERAADKE